MYHAIGSSFVQSQMYQVYQFLGLLKPLVLVYRYTNGEIYLSLVLLQELRISLNYIPEELPNFAMLDNNNW